MVKKFTLFLLLGIIGLFTTNLFAQEDATIDPADIRFWIGEGQNEAIFIANWNEPDTALAWGYRFNTETVTLKTIMDDISDADYRFSYEASGSWLLDMHYNDGILDLSLTEQMWVSFLINGVSSWDTYDVATVANGQYVKLGDTYCGTLVDPENYIYVWEKEVVAVYPLADEATIDPADVVYWIGEGENEVVFAVNFADPEDVCFAWGYRFATESVTIKEMMQAIADVDLRFTFTDESSQWGSMLTDLSFNYNETHYDLNGYNAMYNLNGVQSWYAFDEQTVVNGDFVKWGDYTIGTEIAPWTYVWTTPVQPVSIYNSVDEVEASTLTVYPNPATDYIMVGAQHFTSVEIFDMTGRCVLTSTESKIDVRSLETGVYFVRVNGNATKLVVK